MMIASSVAEHIFWVPFLLLGIGLIVWNRRFARAFNVANDAAIQALGVDWLSAVWDKNKRWYQRFEHVTVIAVGAIFVAVSVLGLVL